MVPRSAGTRPCLRDVSELLGPTEMFLTRVRLQGLGYTECFSGQGFGWLPTKAGGVDLKGWRWCTTPFSLSRPVSALVRQVETFMSAWAQRGVRPAQPPSLPSCTSQCCSAGPLGFRATEARPHRHHGGL